MILLPKGKNNMHQSIRCAVEELQVSAILEFGVGAGNSLRELSGGLKRFSHVVGIDCSNPEQEVDPALLAEPWFEYLQVDAVQIPFDDSTFDLIQISNVLHHLPQPERQERMEELVRVLRPGGYLMVTEFMREKLNGAAQTQNWLHLVRAYVDRSLQRHHYPILHKQEIESLFCRPDLVVVIAADYDQRREDYRDPANLDKIGAFIDTISSNQSLPPLLRTKVVRVCTALKRRMYRTGYTRAPQFCGLFQKST
jgi:SAM-dependent methyltransferase